LELKYSTNDLAKLWWFFWANWES